MSYSRFCYIYIYIYVHTLRKQVLQSHKLDGCTLHRMVYSSAVVKYIIMLFSDFLRSVVFLPQAFRSQLIGFCRSRRAPSPTLLCASAMRSGQLFSACIARRFKLGALYLYKCWITLCWCTKYSSKDNRPLPLLARKWDNRRSYSKTAGKEAVGQS